LVNKAGYVLFGSSEEASIEGISQQFETNFFAVVETTKAIIPTMRNQSSDIIINVNSVGGKNRINSF
jgi:short-subunit dehydrogenase